MAIEVFEAHFGVLQTGPQENRFARRGDDTSQRERWRRWREVSHARLRGGGHRLHPLQHPVPPCQVVSVSTSLRVAISSDNRCCMAALVISAMIMSKAPFDSCANRTRVDGLPTSAATRVRWGNPYSGSRHPSRRTATHRRGERQPLKAIDIRIHVEIFRGDALQRRAHLRAQRRRLRELADAVRHGGRVQIGDHA